MEKVRGSMPGPFHSALSELAIPEAVDEVIVDHADGLHVCVEDRRANEVEAALPEFFAEGVGFG